jgi:glutathione S-transferase
MCPFAQKAWLALECSGCQYQLEEISLYGSGGKPSWFWELNPQGTVPVLVAGREGREEPTILPDSDLILDEFEKENGSDLNWKVSLLPDDSSVRRRVCEWRKLVNTKLIPAGKKAVLGGSKDGMRRVLQQMDGMLTTTYLAGDSVTTADCHVFPFLWRLHQEFGLSDYPNLQRWVEQCQQQSAFRRTIQKAWWWWWW